MKKILSIALALAMVLCLSAAAFAADTYTVTATYSGDGQSYSTALLEGQSFPQPLAASDLMPPTLSFEHLWYWGEFNVSEVGLQLFELAYRVTPNDATDISVDARLSYETWEYFWADLTDTGLVKIKQGTKGDYFYNSTMEWTPEFVLRYRLDGEEHSETLSFPAVRPTGYKPYFNISYDGSTLTASLTKSAGDPMRYTVPGIASVKIEWFENTGGDSWNWLGTEEIWPAAGTMETLTPGSVYRLSFDFSSLTPPTEATHFMLYIDTDDFSAEDENGVSYVGIMGAYTYDDFRPISELSP